MPNPDPQRRYFLTKTASGVGLQVVGAMEFPVYLSWEQAGHLASDLEEFCKEREQEIAGRKPERPPDGDQDPSQIDYGE